MSLRVMVVLAALVFSVGFPFMPISDAHAGDATIVVEPGVFSPQVTTIHAGDRVTWSNRDNVEHFLTSSGPTARPVARTVEDLEFHHLLEPENDYSHAFTSPGTYPYFCAIHLGMSGTVVVEP